MGGKMKNLGTFLVVLVLFVGIFAVFSPFVLFGTKTFDNLIPSSEDSIRIMQGCPCSEMDSIKSINDQVIVYEPGEEK